MPKGSVSASRFAMQPRSDVPRSAFDVTFSHKTTFGADYLVPIFVDEVLPGDSLRLSMTGLARLATPITPIMDNIYLESFFFFVPNRLVWEHWHQFIGDKASPTDTTAYLIPQVPVTDADAGVGSLANYMGIRKPVVGQTYNVSALPFRAFNLIYDDWFRDEALMAPPVLDWGDGPDAMSDFPTVYRTKRPDYFTTCRPWPVAALNQGNTSAANNLGYYQPGYDMTFGIYNQAGAPVTGIGVISTEAPGQITAANIYNTGGRIVSTNPAYQTSSDTIYIAATGTGAGQFPEIRVLVNDIRTSLQVQQLLEKNARGGWRYTEIIREHFGVVSADARQQRPEYLGGGRSVVNINPVAQTSATSGTDVLGELAGIATAVASNHGFSASFTEHGFIIGIVNVRADLGYQHGVRRMWFRRTVFDHYWPSLAHLGEQAVLSKEIYCTGESGDDDVFGYQERWAEYKYHPSIVTGAFNSDYATPLDMWHLAEAFASRPTLNEVFVSSSTPMTRVLQVATVASQEVLFDSIFKLRWVRAMPMYSVPGVGSHF